MRICSFLPSATETVYALGLDEELYGVTHECDYPLEAKSKPKLTSSKLSNQALSSKQIDESVRDSLHSGRGIYSLDFGVLSSAAPDVIFTQQLCEVCAVSYGEIFRAAQKLPSKPEVVSLDTFSLDDILSSIQTVGEKCDRREVAEEYVRGLRRRIEAITSLTHRESPKKVFLMEWIDPIMTSGHWVPELVRRAGGEDGLGQDGKKSRRVSWEELRSYAPEYLVIAPCGFDVDRAEKEARDSLTKLKGWEVLPAVRRGQVFIADGNAYFSRPGPRIVDGLEILACILNSNVAERFLGQFTRNDWRQFR